jgi:hypothetical protein
MAITDDLKQLVAEAKALLDKVLAAAGVDEAPATSEPTSAAEPAATDTPTA